jgi:hypothetical protein
VLPAAATPTSTTKVWNHFRCNLLEQAALQVRHRTKEGKSDLFPFLFYIVSTGLRVLQMMISTLSPPTA